MIYFIVDVLPLSYAEVSRFPYRQFFRTLMLANKEAKKLADQHAKFKNRTKK